MANFNDILTEWLRSLGGSFARDGGKFTYIHLINDKPEDFDKFAREYIDELNRQMREIYD